MNIIVTGATGMVGSEVVRQAIADPDITEITAVTRRPLETSHAKLKTVIHKNFLDYTDLSDVFRSNDACIWCLGISQNQVNKEEYIKITYDYTVAFVRDMVQANPRIGFLFLSGAGADNTERSRFLFGRIKGRTENALMQLPLKRLHIARPAAILPVHRQPNLPFILKLQYSLVTVFKYITPSYVITSVDLARALLYIVKNDPANKIIQHKELKTLAVL